MTSVLSPRWLDTILYPFENKFISVKTGQIHYVDEGEGDIILFVHGTPTWSFLYREYLATLSKEFRCIAIDHIGFGLSEKPKKFDGKPQSHSNNLTEFIEKLDLKEITIVVHDFGGPIGLSSAIQNHHRIKQIVMFNTWLWETKNDSEIQKVDKIINSCIGQFLYLGMNFSPKYLLKKGFNDKKNLSKEVHKHYIKPFPDMYSRTSLLNLGKSLIGSSKFYQEQWLNLGDLDQKPWLILWGNKDEFMTIKYLEKWKYRLPNAIVKQYDCGHFVPEEKAVETMQEIKKFMKSSNSIAPKSIL